MQLVSSDITLNPGDVLASGTPAGTAADSSPRDASGARDPAKFLRVGDTTEVSSKKIGVLRNKIVAKQSLEIFNHPPQPSVFSETGMSRYPAVQHQRIKRQVH